MQWSDTLDPSPISSRAAWALGREQAGDLLLTSLRLGSQPLRTWGICCGSLAHQSSWIWAWLVPWSLHCPWVPLRHHCMDFHFKQVFRAQHPGQARQPWPTPRAGLVLCLSAVTVSLEQLLHASTTLLVHLGRPPSHQCCWGSGGSARCCENQFVQVRGGRSLVCWLLFSGTVLLMKVVIFSVNAGEHGGKWILNLWVPVWNTGWGAGKGCRMTWKNGKERRHYWSSSHNRDSDRDRQRWSGAIRSSFAAPKTLLHFADQLGSRCQHILGTQGNSWLEAARWMTKFLAKLMVPEEKWSISHHWRIFMLSCCTCALLGGTCYSRSHCDLSSL